MREIPVTPPRPAQAQKLRDGDEIYLASDLLKAGIKSLKYRSPIRQRLPGSFRREIRAGVFPACIIMQQHNAARLDAAD